MSINRIDKILSSQNIASRSEIKIMIKKPSGVLSASNDKHAKTVIDLLPENLKRRGLFPAGRLDKDTEGLLIITDDGELSHKMLAPKSHIFKLYEAVTDKVLTENDVNEFKKGINYGE